MNLHREVSGNVDKSEEQIAVMSNSQELRNSKPSDDNASANSLHEVDDMSFVVDDDSEDSGENEESGDRSRTENEHNAEENSQDEVFEENMLSRVHFTFKNPRMVLPITDVNTIIIDPSEV